MEWKWLILAIVILGVSGNIFFDQNQHASLPQPPDTGKLSYELYTKLKDWKSKEHEPEEKPSMVSVLLILDHQVKEKDLQTLRVISDDIVIQGSHGKFVQVKLPITKLEAICELDYVISVSTPPETIPD